MIISQKKDKALIKLSQQQLKPKRKSLERQPQTARSTAQRNKS